MRSNEQSQKVRKTAAAGLFYPGDPASLRSKIKELLPSDHLLEHPKPKAVVVPHAGYSYSGRIAALAYGEIQGRDYERVAIISPSHRTAFQGVSVYPGGFYQSPLGLVPIDREFCEALVDECQPVEFSEQGHKVSPGGQFGEHALEVQLPFLQSILRDFKLVPLVMGQQDLNTASRLGMALGELGNDGRTLILASSDLSHFHSYEKARALDSRLIENLESMDYFSLANLLEIGEVEACGGGAVVAALIAAERLGASECRVLEYINSGDVDPLTRNRVVGYVSAVMTDSIAGGTRDEHETLRVEEREFLLELAGQAVEASVKNREYHLPEEEVPENLKRKAAVFVTINRNSKLRGCIGSIIPHDLLYRAVVSSAVNAASHDPRFDPITERELSELDFEISVLSRFQLVADPSEIDVGKHGLLIQSGYSKGLLLPQVAEHQGWDLETFLEQTCLKASLPRDAWKDSLADLFKFSAEVFGR